MKKSASSKDPIRRDALILLARRDHSQMELTQKLLQKQHSPTQVEVLIADLIQAGLLNDQRFAENYCYWRRLKGYGPLRIKMELENRGVDAETIAEVVQITDNAWLAVAKELWQKRFKPNMTTELKERVKQMRFLQYRGYTREQIERLFYDNKEEQRYSKQQRDSQ